MSKILVVEDDNFFRQAIAQFLESKGHTSTQAANGKIAKNILQSELFDLIISDVQMPHVDGVELLSWIKEHKPIPFILMTGFTHLLETQSAFDLGADDFLVKPFKNEDLTQSISKILSQKSEPATSKASNSEMIYCKFSIDEFLNRSHIDFDVYLRLSDTKFVKIAHKGDSAPVDRIKQYKINGIHFLYILKTDFRTLVNFNIKNMSQALQFTNMPSLNKIELVRKTGELILEHVFVVGIDDEVFQNASEFVMNTVTLICEQNENAYQLLESLNLHSEYVYTHSLGVAMYSIMIAKKMDFTSSQLLFKLGLAGIFHDIGKKELPSEIIHKASAQMTQKERILLESHPARSKDILADLKNIPSDVIQMVYEHHEDCEGQGYPRGLAKNEIHPLTKILSLANLFVGQALKSPSHIAMPAKHAISYIEDTYLDRLDLAVLSALKKLFADIE